MKSKAILVLKIYALFLVALGGKFLIDGITMSLQQGKFILPFLTYALPFGIGLFYRNRQAWRLTLTALIVFLVFDVFVFLMSATSNTSIYDSYVTIVSKGATETKVPSLTFYSISLSLLVGQIWLLFSRPIKQILLPETHEKSAHI
jgi:hypothetical protein